MKNFIDATEKLLVKKRVVIKILNNELTDKKRKMYGTVRTTLPTTMTGFR